jgi:hypothetical protein
LAALLEATLKAATGSAPEERSTKSRERRPARTLEEIFVDEPTFDAGSAVDEREERNARKEARAEKSRRAEKTERFEESEKPAKREESAKNEKTEKSERRPRRDEPVDEPKQAKRKSAEPAWDDLDDGDDYDPIAFWERLAADDDDEEDETPVARSSAERPKKRRETADDFEDWSDEVAAKKKSGRTRERTEDEPTFETAPSSRFERLARSRLPTSPTAKRRALTPRRISSRPRRTFRRKK